MAEPEILSKEKPATETALVDTGSRMSEILAAQARASVNAHYLIAQQNKRDWDVVRNKLLSYCDRPRFAEVAFKRKPGISEPMLTIRFAEAVQQAMGNLEPTRVIVFESPTQRIVRLGLSDLETNNHPTRDLVIEKVVERKNLSGRRELSHRMNTQGEIVYLVEATEDEMFTKESAWGSKWERQLTLKHLPADIKEECEDRCMDTQRKQDKSDPEASKKKLVDAFYSLGITADQLKQYIGSDNLDILSRPLKDGERNHQLEDLRQIYTAIKEGDTNWREVMESRTEARGAKATGEHGGTQTQQQSSGAAAKVKAAASAKAAKATAKQQEPSGANPPQASAATDKTENPKTAVGAEKSTQEAQNTAKREPAPVENPDAEPAPDLFSGQNVKPEPTSTTSQQAPPPIELEEWA
jgi:hypothetical protein